MKLAIKITNKYEFSVIMKHYEDNGNISDGWQSKPTTLVFEPDETGIEYVVLKNGELTYRIDGADYDPSEGVGLDFGLFCKIAGIIRKEITIEVGTFKATINEEAVTFFPNIHYLSFDKLEEIYAAYKSLQ